MIKPILFNYEMVRAILEDRKTVTRRICKDCNDFIIPDMRFYDSARRTYAVHGYTDKEHKNQLFTAERPCPICPGDILYVKEKWCENPNYIEFYYAAKRAPGVSAPYGLRWRPSIHMPKEAARIWLKVTDVRVERLQAMTLDDYLSEGVTVRPEAFNDPKNAYLQARSVFITIWDSTIKKADKCRYSWSADPWVWVIAFERCQKPENLNY